tara:strand:- start:1 stop:396 length:396 start_codon:yes stop_codon:yes gene_type:complete
MSEVFKELIPQETLLIAFGSIIGSLLRLYLTRIFFVIFSRKYLGTLIVNSIASFLLALLWASSIYKNTYYSKFILFYATGFLGSLSTFSTYIIEVLEAFINKYWIEALVIAFASVLVSVFFGWIGLLIAFD